MIKFSPTEQILVNILQDGMPHSKSELKAALDGEYTSDGSIRVHMHSIRKKLNPLGQTVICEFYKRNLAYRWVRLLGNPYK